MDRLKEQQRFTSRLEAAKVGHNNSNNNNNNDLNGKIVPNLRC